MATQKISFGTRTALTITIASLTNGSYQESTIVDNSSDLAVDGILAGKLTTGTSPTSGNTFTIYVVGSDGTSAQPANLSGSNAGVTVSGEQYQMEVARIIPVDSTSNHTYEFYIGSIAALFGGVMPKKFSVVVLNGTGATLNSTGSNHDIEYTPVNYTIV